MVAGPRLWVVARILPPMKRSACSCRPPGGAKELLILSWLVRGLSSLWHGHTA